MPSNFFTNPAANLTILLILVGLVGTVVPVIPGPPLIWLGMLAWAIGENFQRVDWITLIILGIIALAATFSEFWLAPFTQQRAGFGWKHILAAFIGGIAGAILLSEVPIIGTLFGAAVGSVVGTGAFTFWQTRSFPESLRAGRTYLVGCFLAAAIEVGFSLLMIVIFVWQAFLT